MSSNTNPHRLLALHGPTGQPLIGRAPAKLNLRLKLTGRRADGYHLLSMLNVTIGLHDTISIRLAPAGQGSIAVTAEPGLLRGERLDVPENLACRAATRLFDALGLPLAAAIEIEKRIPLGAGLGGGSSDAAAVLGLLAGALRAAGVACDERMVAELALPLGADVPYLVRGGFAHVSGIGERVAELPAEAVRGWQCVVLVPEFGNDTREVYARLRAERPSLPDSPDTRADELVSGLRAGDPGALRERLLAAAVNELEPVAIRMRPELGTALERLRAEREIYCAMSGSGSALFALPRGGLAFDQAVRDRLFRTAAELKLRWIDTTLAPLP